MPADREFAEKVHERQESIIGAINTMNQTMEITRDAVFEIRTAVFALDKWLRIPPTDTLAKALNKLSEAVEANTVEVQRLGARIR